MIFFRSEYRAHPDHEIVGTEAKLDAFKLTIALAERLPVRKIDAVVNHFSAPCSEQTAPPVALLCLADENKAIRSPKQRAIVEHLQPFLCARQQRAVECHGNAGAHTGLAQGKPCIHQRIWIGCNDHLGLDSANMRGEVCNGVSVEIAPRIQATNAACAAQANPVELLGCALDVHRMAFMAALCES